MMRYLFMVIGAGICALLGYNGGGELAFGLMSSGADNTGSNLMLLAGMAIGGALLCGLVGGGIGYYLGDAMQRTVDKDGAEPKK